MGIRIRTMLDLAELLLVGAGLGPGTYGEVIIKRQADGVRIMHRSESWDRKALSEMPVPGVSSEP